MIPAVAAAGQLTGDENGAQQHHVAADILQGVEGADGGNAQRPDKEVGHPQGEGQTQKPHPAGQPVPAPKPLDQVEQGNGQRGEAEEAVDDLADGKHPGNGPQGPHRRRIVHTRVVVGVVCALYDDLRGAIHRQRVDPVHDTRGIGLQAALFAHKLAVDVDSPGAEQLRQVQGQFHSFSRILQNQAVGGGSVGTAQVVGEVGVFADVGIELRRDAVRKVRRLQQLTGVIFPTIHQKKDLFRVILKDIVAVPAGQGGSVLVIKLIQQRVK